MYLLVLSLLPQYPTSIKARHWHASRKTKLYSATLTQPLPPPLFLYLMLALAAAATSSSTYKLTRTVVLQPRGKTLTRSGVNELLGCRGSWRDPCELTFPATRWRTFLLSVLLLFITFYGIHYFVIFSALLFFSLWNKLDG